MENHRMLKDLKTGQLFSFLSDYDGIKSSEICEFLGFDTVELRKEDLILVRFSCRGLDYLTCPLREVKLVF